MPLQRQATRSGAGRDRANGRRRRRPHLTTGSPPRDIALLVNPVAGRGRGARAGARAAAALRTAGVRVLELAGRDAAEAADLARDSVSRDVDALVVVGGDGMVHLGLQVMAGTQMPMGIIPAGTGNDIARAIGLPRRDPAAAAQVVAHGAVRRIDLGRSDGAWFGGVAAAGFDALVNDRANRMTWPRGRTRYNLALLLELGLFRPVPYEMCLDDVTLRLEAMLVAVANGPCYGAGMRVAPQASVDDGLLDVLIVHRISKAELVRVFPRVYRGTHVGHPAVEIRRARTVRLAAPGITAYADGERLGALPRDFVAVPGALRVLAPAAVPAVPGG